MNIFSFLFKKKQPRQIKLGLALGSGGAKGFAELGAIKAFEENGIEFDIVAGTSIGSVLGAFYAQGYSSTDMLELLKTVNFGDIKSTFMINMDTSGLFNVIDDTIGSMDIERLKKPFMAVATDMDSGDEYVFKEGNVALALCASSSYPPFFKPVVIDNKRYIDGAFSNAVPADLARQMGADYVVAIDLSNHEPKSGGILSKIFPTYQGKVSKPWQKGYEFSDVVLHPDLTEYKPISFGQANEMYDIGYHCAILNMPKILEDIENLKNPKKNKLVKK